MHVKSRGKVMIVVGFLFLVCGDTIVVCRVNLFHKLIIEFKFSFLEEKKIYNIKNMVNSKATMG